MDREKTRRKLDTKDLPGVGKKITLALGGGDRLEVVVRTGGSREIFFFRRGEEEPSHSVCLDRSVACALGVALCDALAGDEDEEE